MCSSEKGELTIRSWEEKGCKLQIMVLVAKFISVSLIFNTNFVKPSIFPFTMLSFENMLSFSGICYQLPMHEIMEPKTSQNSYLL